MLPRESSFPATYTAWLNLLVDSHTHFGTCVRDVVGIIRDFLRPVALSFCFGEDVVWTLWRLPNGQLFYGDGTHRIDATPPRGEFIRYEIEYSRATGLGIFCVQREHVNYPDSNRVPGFHWMRKDEFILIHQHKSDLQELYLYPAAGVFSSYGIHHVFDPKYVTIRFNRDVMYGLLPDGTIAAA